MVYKINVFLFRSDYDYNKILHDYLDGKGIIQKLLKRKVFPFGKLNVLSLQKKSKTQWEDFNHQKLLRQGWMKN